MPPGLGRGTGLPGKVGIESRVGYRGPCRSVLPASYPSGNGGRRGYMHTWNQGGTKIWGVLCGVMVSVARVTMGRVYPEKEAGPLGPAGVRMSGRRGPPAEEAEEGGQARAGFAGGGRGPLCPGGEGSGHVRTEKGRAGASSVAWRGRSHSGPGPRGPGVRTHDVSWSRE